MDNRIIKHVLRECNEVFLENVSPEPIVNFLWSKGIVTDRDRGIINAANGRIGKAGELLDALITKSDRALDVLLEYFERDGSQEHVLNALKKSKQKFESEQAEAKSVTEHVTSVPPDFQITSKHTHTITKIIAEDPIAISQWSSVMNEFITKATHRYEVNKQIKENHIQQAIQYTFELWISYEGRGATFSKLISGFKASDCKNLPGILEGKKEEIWKIGV